ncbi:hypothetical protein DSO57_1027764 [Entomophthora muscae]|uniref:Uncharacterized protein n=1 Tax=Entomophthora muscae TaxID=34485 RepID=A0ACC2S3V8_9FUNG|nr:hypothetical protein DSO57_1027764 [Entomophthora muscae]
MASAARFRLAGASPGRIGLYSGGDVFPGRWQVEWEQDDQVKLGGDWIWCTPMGILIPFNKSSDKVLPWDDPGELTTPPRASIFFFIV